MAFFLIVPSVMIVSVLLIHALAKRLGLRIYYTTLIAVAVVSVMVNLAAATITPAVGREYLLRLGLMIFASATCLTWANRFLLIKELAEEKKFQEEVRAAYEAEKQKDFELAESPIDKFKWDDEDISFDKPSAYNEPSNEIESSSENAEPSTEIESPAENAEPSTEIESPAENAEPSNEIESPSENAEPSTEIESSSENAEPSTEIESSAENAEPSNKIESPSENAEPSNKIESPSENAEPSTEIKSPSENAEPSTEIKSSAENAEPSNKIESPSENAEPSNEIEPPLDDTESSIEADNFPLEKVFEPLPEIKPEEADKPIKLEEKPAEKSDEENFPLEEVFEPLSDVKPEEVKHFDTPPEKKSEHTELFPLQEVFRPLSTLNLNKIEEITREEKSLPHEEETNPEEKIDTLDDLLDKAYDERDKGNIWQAIDTYKKALERYRNDEYAPFVAIDLGNLYKDRAMYSKAIKIYEEALTLPAVERNPSIKKEFVDKLEYLRILHEVLIRHHALSTPFNLLSREILQEIDNEFKQVQVNSPQ